MMRIIMIQTQILDRLGFQQQPNVNVSATLSEADRRAYARIFKDIKTDDDDKERDLYEDDYYAKRYLWDLPSCDTPRRADPVAWSTDGDLFRLYFDIKLNHRLEEETRVSSATLSLYKKSFTGCECELISKDNQVQPQNGPARRRRHVAQPDTVLEDELDEIDSEDDEDDEDDEEETSDDEHDHTDKIRVTLYQYTKPVKKKRREKRVELDSILVSKRQEGWVKFRIGDVVANWMKNPMKNFGLVLIAEDMQHRVLNANLLFEDYNCTNSNNQSHFPIPLALPGSSVSERNRTTQHLHANQTFPYLEVITKNVPIEDDNIRFRRDLSKRRTKGCARQEMYVSFAELGWNDWIIQPLGFDAGYCKGTCSTVVDDPSGSLKIKHFTSKLPDGVEFTQFECCGPRKLKPLQILHFDQNGKMAVSIFDDFIITQCGCRP